VLNRETLVKAHLDSLYRFCLRLCGGRIADAEDLAQDAFLQAWKNRDTFEGRSKITTWLMRIALNRHLRLRAVAATHGETSSEAIEDTALPDATDSVLERMELNHALDQLPEALRSAFLLVKVEGLKYREAAEVLSVPCGTVQWQVHEAVQRLRALLLEEKATVSVASDHKASPEVSHAM